MKWLWIKLLAAAAFAVPIQLISLVDQPLGPFEFWVNALFPLPVFTVAVGVVFASDLKGNYSSQRQLWLANPFSRHSGKLPACHLAGIAFTAAGVAGLARLFAVHSETMYFLEPLLCLSTGCGILVGIHLVLSRRIPSSTNGKSETGTDSPPQPEG